MSTAERSHLPSRNPLRVYQNRRPLSYTQKAISEGHLTGDFIGGAITDARTRDRWPEPVIAWLVENYPDVRIKVENAAIGATGSDLAVFRAERDLLQRNCDLVFVEYAVNDRDQNAEIRRKAREGLIRKLLSRGACDVMLVYTFAQDMYKEMVEGNIPPSIGEFEQLAEHYQLNSVWVGLYALEELRKGRMKWEDWLPDGLHPQQRGSLSYAQAVSGYLKDKLSEARDGLEELELKCLPDPLYADNWEKTAFLSFDKVKTFGPWYVERSCDSVWMDELLTTASVGAELQFEFEGRGLSLGFNFGKRSSEFEYALDGGAWETSCRERPVWCGDQGWFKIFHLADGLENGRHQLCLRVIHGDGDRSQWQGTNFKLAFIGVIQNVVPPESYE